MKAMKGIMEIKDNISKILENNNKYAMKKVLIFSFLFKKSKHNFKKGSKSLIFIYLTQIICNIK